MEHRDVHTPISPLTTPSMAMGEMENHKHPCGKGPTRISPTPRVAQALSVCPLCPGSAVRNSRKNTSEPHSSKQGTSMDEDVSRCQGMQPTNAEFHALSTHPPISNSLMGIPSGSKPLPSSHLLLLNCFSTQQLDFTGGPSLPSTPLLPTCCPKCPQILQITHSCTTGKLQETHSQGSGKSYWGPRDTLKDLVSFSLWSLELVAILVASTSEMATSSCCSGKMGW